MERLENDLKPFFHPESIAIVGVPRGHSRFGGASYLSKFQECKFPGRLYPINPKADEIQGVKAYPTLDSLPEVPDLVMVCLPAGAVLDVLKECARILKPGKPFIAAVPNARIYLEAYQNPQDFDPRSYCIYEPAYHYNSRIDYVNYMAYMGGEHKYMFDEENVLAILKMVGFSDVQLRTYDPSLDLEGRDYESIYVQAKK